MIRKRYITRMASWQAVSASPDSTITRMGFILKRMSSIMAPVKIHTEPGKRTWRENGGIVYIFPETAEILPLRHGNDKAHSGSCRCGPCVLFRSCTITV